MKQNVAPLQANEVSILRRKCQQFEVGYPHPRPATHTCVLAHCQPLEPEHLFHAAPQVKQQEFREKFREEAPFSFSSPEPYKALNKVLRAGGRRPHSTAARLPGPPLLLWGCSMARVGPHL